MFFLKFRVFFSIMSHCTTTACHKQILNFFPKKTENKLLEKNLQLAKVNYEKKFAKNKFIVYRLPRPKLHRTEQRLVPGTGQWKLLVVEGQRELQLAFVIFFVLARSPPQHARNRTSPAALASPRPGSWAEPELPPSPRLASAGAAAVDVAARDTARRLRRGLAGGAGEMAERWL